MATMYAGGIFMISKSARRVVIIKDIKSANIEQAIFILKDKESVGNSSDIINEANEIVQNYIMQSKTGLYRKVHQKRKWFGKKKK
jgi:hypothetical protein